MLPSSNQPAQLYGTAKTHKFDDINEITVDSLKFRSIIAPKRLYKNNDFIIKNTQDFAQILREQPPLEENKEYVSYDIDLL